MKKATKKAKRVKKREYLVGLAGGGEPVYGGCMGYAFPTTKTRAEHLMAALLSDYADRAIYRLVPVKVVKGKR